MPLYEYQCDACNTRYERIEKASAPTDGVCPECGGNARRLLGAPALQFKGSGWYVNDYGKGNGSAPSATTESTSEPKSETAAEPASTSETSAKKDTKVA